MPAPIRDLKFVFRSLGRNRSLITAAILSLALGIGANTAIFTLTDQMLLRVLPVKEPQRLVQFEWAGRFIGGTSRGYKDAFSYLTYVDLRSGNPGAFSGIAARHQETADIADNGLAQRATVELVSGNYFDVLGVSTAIGRPLTSDDDKVKDGAPYVVLSYDYWRRRFGGQQTILDRSIDINGHPMTVIGVAQQGFSGFESMNPTDVFVPMSMKTVVTPTWDDRQRRDSIWLRIFARLSPGVDPRAAQSAIAAAYHSSLQNDLRANPRPEALVKRYLTNTLQLTDASKGFGQMQRFFAKPLQVLLAMVGTLLLIACVNVANLLITRAATRQKEIAIRLSLGATRWSLVRLVMTESVLLAAFSGFLGVLLSSWIASILVGMLPYDNIGSAIRTTPDIRILSFTAGLSLLTAILFGCAPALQATHPDLAETLKSESGKLSTGSAQTGLRRLLVSTQVALSMLLLFGAGLFAKSLYTLLSSGSGMQTSRLLALSVDPSLHKYTPDRSRRLFQDLQNNLGHLPGVESVSAAVSPVLANDNWQNTVHIEGYRPTESENMNPGFNAVLPGFFQTAGVSLIAGRDFTERDIAGATKVVIVNENFVKRFFPHESPLGRHIGWGDTGPMPMEIVGVVKDLKGGDLREKIKPWTFTPALQEEKPSEITYYIRTTQDPISLAQAARQSVMKLDVALPVFNVKTVERQIQETHFLDRLFAWLSAAFGVLATLLASVGLYGVTANAVTRRTQEIGIRMALGATQSNVVNLVLREVLLLTTAGVAAGVLAAVALGRLVESQLFGVKANDASVMMVAAVVIITVSALAGYLPARRATRIDPLNALHYE